MPLSQSWTPGTDIAAQGKPKTKELEAEESPVSHIDEHPIGASIHILIATARKEAHVS